MMDRGGRPNLIFALEAPDHRRARPHWAPFRRAVRFVAHQTDRLPIRTGLDQPGQLFLHRGGVRVALSRIETQRAHDHGLEARRHARIDVLDGPVGECEWRLQPGIAARQDMVHRRANPIHVAGWTCLTAILFRRGVAFGPDHGALLAHLERLGDAKIDQSQPPVLVDHDVRRLDVTKDDRLRLMEMQVAQHIAQFERPLQHRLDRQKVAHRIDDRFQVAPVDVFHHQIRAILAREVIVDLRHRGMAERCQHIRLALERAQRHLAHALIGGQVEHLFDGDVPHHIRKTEIPRLVHRPHAADADHAGDPVAPLEHRTGLKRPFT